MDRTIAIGTVIHGTLRDQDLLPAFADELERVGGPELDYDLRNGSELIAEARQLVEIGFTYAEFNGETSSECVNELMDALQDYAPVHMYFGSIEGDGADFGWWPTDPRDTCETVCIDDENVIDIECNIHINVNDHGNVTVSELRGAVIWAAV